MAQRDSSLLTQVEIRLLSRELRSYAVPLRVIADILEISIDKASKLTRGVQLNKEAIPAPPLTLADAIAFLNAEGFEVIAMAEQPSRRSLQAERRDAA